MTSSRYLVARFAQAFGFFRKNQRMADAASEMHLLREAEAQLGFAIWEKVKDIEELSVEYWNLRRFVKERDIVRQKIEDCQEVLSQAHEERSALINQTPILNQELLDTRNAILAELETLAIQRDEIVAMARDVRRSYDGLRAKLDVLTKESDSSSAHSEEIAEAKSKLGELKIKFAELKQKRTDIGKQLDDGDKRMDEVEAELERARKERRLDASEAFQVIGDNNKQLSELRAGSELLDTKMRQLYAEIGRYVSRHAKTNAACATAAASHQGLVEVMRALRRSIALNHRLAGTM
jgi:chromosome segregation ATPase